jgi:uncharacterized lipoprotein YajG
MKNIMLASALLLLTACAATPTPVSLQTPQSKPTNAPIEAHATPIGSLIDPDMESRRLAAEKLAADKRELQTVYF